MEPDGGTTNIRNVNSKHWTRWLGPEHRCVVPFNSFNEFNKVEGRDIWFAMRERSGGQPANLKTTVCLLIPFGPGRSDRACRSGRPWGTRRSGKAAVLYHHVSRIRPGRDLYDTSGRKLRSNPPKPSGRSALDFHGFAWTDPDLHAGLAGSSYSSDDDQLALRYGGGCYEYFRMRAFSPRNRKASYKSSNGAKRLCEHHRPPCFPHRFACVAHRRLRDQLGAKAPVLDIGYGSRLFELIELGKLVGDTKADDVP